LHVLAAPLWFIGWPVPCIALRSRRLPSLESTRPASAACWQIGAVHTRAACGSTHAEKYVLSVQLGIAQAARARSPEWAAPADADAGAEAGAYEDMRWRLIRLEPHGRAWELRAAAADAAAAAGGAGGLRCLSAAQAAELV